LASKLSLAGPALWRLEARSGKVDHWPLPKPVGAFTLRAKGGFLLAFR